METEYSTGMVIQLAELVHLFTSWGMNQGKAIRLAIPLTFPHAFNDDEFKEYASSFLQGSPCILSRPVESSSE